MEDLTLGAVEQMEADPLDIDLAASLSLRPLFRSRDLSQDLNQSEASL